MWDHIVYIFIIGLQLGYLFLIIGDNQKIRLMILNIISIILIASQIFLSVQFFHENTRYVLVQKYLSRGLSPLIRVSRSWVGTEGTLLVWALFLSIIQILLEMILIGFPIIDKRIALFTSGTFSSLIYAALFIVDPLQTTNSTSPLGFGAHPTLSSGYIIIHPLLSFAGYSISLIPYSIYLSRVRSEYVLMKINIMCAISSSLFLTAIITGGIWSFEALWGGFWTWDPVENLSLAIFLASILPLHARRIAHVKRYALSAICFPIVLLSSFIIRSGLLKDPHSYASQGEAIVLLFLFILSLLPFVKEFRKKFAINITSQDLGVSLFLFLSGFIILFITITHVILLYLVKVELVPTVPKPLFHYLILGLLLIILTYVLSREFFLVGWSSYFIIIPTLALLLPVLSKNLFATGFFVTMTISPHFIKKTNYKGKINDRTPFLPQRIGIHLAVYLLILIALNAYYTQSAYIVFLEENETQNAFGQKITIIKVENEDGFNWETRVILELSGERLSIYAGWNEVHGYYSIPAQIYQGLGVLQVHLRFIQGNVYSGDPVKVYHLEIRQNATQNFLRWMGYLTIFLTVLPVDIKRRRLIENKKKMIPEDHF